MFFRPFYYYDTGCAAYVFAFLSGIGVAVRMREAMAASGRRSRRSRPGLWRTRLGSL
jgi:hypothetical protein